MKKVIFTILSFCFIYFQSNGQHCATPSGPSVCVSLDTATSPGLAPLSDSLAPVVNGTSVSTVIQFENFDTIRYQGQLATIYALRIDTIGNLPSGLCWASNVANDSFANKAYGCIALTGTVCAPPGQYKLHLIVTANVGNSTFPINIPVNGDAAKLYYYIRVNNAGDPITPIDTTGEAAGTIASFIPYGSETAQGCVSGISDISTHINALSIYPNPLSTEAD